MTYFLTTLKTGATPAKVTWDESVLSARASCVGRFLAPVGKMRANPSWKTSLKTPDEESSVVSDQWAPVKGRGVKGVTLETCVEQFKQTHFTNVNNQPHLDCNTHNTDHGMLKGLEKTELGSGRPSRAPGEEPAPQVNHGSGRSSRAPGEEPAPQVNHGS